MIVSTKMIVINNENDSIPVNLSKEIEDGEEIFIIDIDGVEWVVTDNRVHATIMFNMFAEHITEYMHYEKR